MRLSPGDAGLRVSEFAASRRVSHLWCDPGATRGVTAEPSRSSGSDVIQSVSERRAPRCERIVVSENVSLDGVVQDPAGDEGGDAKLLQIGASEALA